MGILTVELGIPYTGWPVRCAGDYAFGLDLVTSGLRDRIEHWAKDFAQHFDENGWDAEENRASHAAEGIALRRLLQDELGPGYDVVLDPTGSGLTPQ